ncbi:PREDICTED: F-box protein At5g25290-like [Camelina sativa]|uniref:F-box protein At5g25290-like n=1 Tax=Camelina sativa TaxID=90675 RepID=A0ABM0Y0V5_CAMSA|nr:PREDICTED: F-box protein At5g25290-like [Camelina sativa]
MATPTSTSSRWSELPDDILKSVFERLRFVDFHRAKIVCPNWYLCSKQTLPRKKTSPLLIMFPKGGECALYNPEEARVYKTKRDLSKIRFLANSGNWFLILDSKSNLYIIDLFSEKTINLPPLESIKGDQYNLERVGDKEFKEVGIREVIQKSKNLRGLLWVDEKKEEYVVVWYFHISQKHMIEYIAVCKNGEDHYREILTRLGLQQVIYDMVLLPFGDSLYVSTTNGYVHKLDLYGQEGLLEDISFLRPPYPSSDDKTVLSNNIAVTVSGEVLLVQRIFYQLKGQNIFRLYKKDPIHKRMPLVKVDSLGDEAMLLDLGITVPADRNLGIEPNSIYFTRHDRACKRGWGTLHLDICVFNLATKKIKCFPWPSLSKLKLKDARWFLPS